MSVSDVFDALRMVFDEDIRLRIIAMLAEREEASLRELARSLGVAHKSLARYLDELTEKGIVETFEPEAARRAYRIAGQHAYLKELFTGHVSPGRVGTGSQTIGSGISDRSRDIEARSPRL